MKKFINFLMVAVLAVGFAACGEQEPIEVISSLATGSIEVTVSTEAGTIADAEVALYTASYDDEPVLETKTDSAGVALIERLAEGNYIVVVNAVIDGQEFSSTKATQVLGGNAVTLTVDPTSETGSFGLIVRDDAAEAYDTYLTAPIEFALVPFNPENLMLPFAEAWEKNVKVITVEGEPVITDGIVAAEYMIFYKINDNIFLLDQNHWISNDYFSSKSISVNGLYLALSGEWELTSAYDVNDSVNVDLPLSAFLIDYERNVKMAIADTVDGKYVEALIEGYHNSAYDYEDDYIYFSASNDSGIPFDTSINGNEFTLEGNTMTFRDDFYRYYYVNEFGNITYDYIDVVFTFTRK